MKESRRRSTLSFAAVTSAETAKPNEFEAGCKFLRALLGDLGLTVANVIIVPGNHDLSWTKCNEIDLYFIDGEISAADYPERLYEGMPKNESKPCRVGSNSA